MQGLPEKLSLLPWQNNCKPPSAASDIVRAKVVTAQQMTTEDALKKTLLLRFNIEVWKSSLQCFGIVRDKLQGVIYKREREERFMSVCARAHMCECVCVQLYASISLHMLKITNTGSHTSVYHE